MRHSHVALMAWATTVSACFVNIDDYLGRACDDSHPCPGQRVCEAGVCVATPGGGGGGNPGTDSGVTDGGSDAGTIDFRGDFESGGLSPWEGFQAGTGQMANQFQVVTSPVRQGRYAARLFVRPGDSFGSTERGAAVWMGSNETEGDDYYYGFSIRFPTDWSVSGRRVLSFASRIGTPMPVIFEAGADSLTLKLYGGNVDAPSTAQFSLLSTLEKNVWHDFILHVVWSADAQRGKVEVWHRVEGNALTSVLSSAAATLQLRPDAGVAAPYVLFGLIRDPAQVTDTLYIDRFVRGTSYAVVAAELSP